MNLAQIGILIFGCSAVYLVGNPDKRVRRWGYLLGLCGQPFWFWSSYQAGQWGIFALCCWYTFAWGKGAWGHWHLRCWLFGHAFNDEEVCRCGAPKTYKSLCWEGVWLALVFWASKCKGCGRRFGRCGCA